MEGRCAKLAQSRLSVAHRSFAPGPDVVLRTDSPPGPCIVLAPVTHSRLGAGVNGMRAYMFIAQAVPALLRKIRCAKVSMMFLRTRDHHMCATGFKADRDPACSPTRPGWTSTETKRYTGVTELLAGVVRTTGRELQRNAHKRIFAQAGC